MHHPAEGVCPASRAAFHGLKNERQLAEILEKLSGAG